MHIYEITSHRTVTVRVKVRASDSDHASEIAETLKDSDWEIMETNYHPECEILEVMEDDSI